MQRLHTDDGCAGLIHSYLRRFHPPADSSYERCFSLLWCSDCRTYSTQTVHVPRSTTLDDPLADLAAEERARLVRKERHLVKHLDLMVRRGQL